MEIALEEKHKNTFYKIALALACTSLSGKQVADNISLSGTLDWLCFHTVMNQSQNRETCQV